MKAKNQLRVGIIGVVILLTGSLFLAACGSPAIRTPVSRNLTTTEKNVLETCLLLPDQEMAEMRGCYDNLYTFGLDIIGNIDLTNRNFGLSAQFKAQVENSVNQIKNASAKPMQVSFTNGQASFSDGAVAYQAGIGTNSLGSGIMQVVMVAGNNNLVIANTNVTLNISNLGAAKPLNVNGLLQPLTTMGIR
jgi:hypothetical protein